MLKPRPSQIELAEKRYKICNDCSSKKSILSNAAWAEVCGECGCPLKAKVFSDVYNPCDLNKWSEVDKKYFK